MKERARAAYDSVLEFRRAYAENERRTNNKAVCEEADRLWNASNEAERALIETPAPDGAALLYKLELLFGEDARDREGFSAAWEGERIDAVMADARRLLSHGRA